MSTLTLDFFLQSLTSGWTQIEEPGFLKKDNLTAEQQDELKTFLELKYFKNVAMQLALVASQQNDQQGLAKLNDLCKTNEGLRQVAHTALSHLAMTKGVGPILEQITPVKSA